MRNSSGKILLLVLLVLVAVWLAVGRDEPAPALAPTPPVMAANAPERLAAVYAADQIEDPVERCRAFPTPAVMPQDHPFYALYCEEAATNNEIAEIKALLNAGEFARVDELLAGYQAEYLATGEREYRVYSAIRFFYDASHWSDEISRAWLEARPESPGALTARADVLFAQAYHVNAGYMLSTLSEADRERYRALIKEGNKLQIRAYEQNPDSLMAIRGRLVAGDFDSLDEFEAVFQRGLALDERTYNLRWTYYHELPSFIRESEDRVLALREQVYEDLADDPRLPSFEQSRYIDAGRYYWRQGDQDAYWETIDESLEVTPILDILRFAASAYNDAGDSLTEFELLSKASSYGRRSPETEMDRAKILNDMGEYQWAADILEKAIERHPGYFWSFSHLAVAYQQLGRYADAVAMHKARLKYDTDNSYSLRNIAWLYINPLGQPEAAIPYIEQLLVIEPEDGWAWALRVDSLRAAGGEPFYNALEQYLRYVDRSNLSHEQAILEAEATLAERDRALQAAADEDAP